MYTSVSGFYENGQVFLTEPLAIPAQKVEVIVTFLDKKENKETLSTKNIVKFGGFEGLITISDDFNEPLEDLKEYMY